MQRLLEVDHRVALVGGEGRAVPLAFHHDGVVRGDLDGALATGFALVLRDVVDFETSGVDVLEDFGCARVLAGVGRMPVEPEHDVGGR